MFERVKAAIEEIQGIKEIKENVLIALGDLSAIQLALGQLNANREQLNALQGKMDATLEAHKEACVTAERMATENAKCQGEIERLKVERDALEAEIAKCKADNVRVVGDAERREAQLKELLNERDNEIIQLKTHPPKDERLEAMKQKNMQLGRRKAKVERALAEYDEIVTALLNGAEFTPSDEFDRQRERYDDFIEKMKNTP